MKLQDKKGSYDVIFSLGSACNPAMLLRQHNLRRLAGPLDWKVSLSLSDVSRLLKNRFTGFMELENMHLQDDTHYFLEDGDAVMPDDGSSHPIKSYWVTDTYYNIISMHDFPILLNQHWTVTYPSFKEKLNHRINRFLEEIANGQSVLFVRWAASYDQAVELQSVLSKMVKGEFKILILQPGVQDKRELDWGIERVCAIEVLDIPFDNSTWEYVLNGITLNMK